MILTGNKIKPFIFKNNSTAIGKIRWNDDLLYKAVASFEVETGVPFLVERLRKEKEYDYSCFFLTMSGLEVNRVKEAVQITVTPSNMPDNYSVQPILRISQTEEGCFIDERGKRHNGHITRIVAFNHHVAVIRSYRGMFDVTLPNQAAPMLKADSELRLIELLEDDCLSGDSIILPKIIWGDDRKKMIRTVIAQAVYSFPDRIV